MAHVSNFTQDPQKILIDLINEDNNTSLSVESVDVALHEEQIVTEKNTRILVTPKAGSGYSGSVALEYNRLNIQDFVDLYYPEQFIIPLGDTETFLDLIPEIEAGLGIKLTENLDYEDQIIEPWAGIPNETKLIQVPILPTSLIYLGELEFILDGNDIPLETVLTNLILNGLNLPTGEEPEVQHLETLYAGVDYTTVPGDHYLGRHIAFMGDPEDTLPNISWKFISDDLESEWFNASDLQADYIAGNGFAYQQVPAEYTSANGQIAFRSNEGYDASERITPRVNLSIASIVHFQTDRQPFVLFNKPNLVSVPDYLPRSAVSIESMFADSALFNDANVASWDVSRVKKMGYVFGRASTFNQDISGWNTRNVEDMEDMFWNATAFNQDLSGWDVSKVTNHDGYDSGASSWVSGNKPAFQG